MGVVGKRKRGFGSGIVDLRQREVGDLAPRAFAKRARASEDLVLRLGIQRKLDRHRGCVNTVSFNENGNVLVSGSDDRKIMLWDWDVGLVKLSFYSGHVDNVFQARFMPCLDDRTIITCAADGQVRLAQLLEGGEVSTTMLAKHAGRAHRLAIEPGSPHIFYSCGEDGLVQHFDLRTKCATKLFKCKCFDQAALPYLSIINLNAIAIDPQNTNLFAIAGGDVYARVYDIRKYKWSGSTDCGYPCDCFCPPHLIGGELGFEITGLAFSVTSELLATYNDEFIYLFTRGQGLGSNPIPASPVPVVDNDAGNGSDLFSTCLSTADSTAIPSPQVYKGHRNRDTVKGVNFFGPSCEYVVSGSDCGRLFIWRKKDGELLRAMEGDKYVVNCIEPHPYVTMIASCGIEKDIKIWVPNAKESAPPVNMDEFLTADYLANYGSDSDYNGHDHNGDSDDGGSFDDDDDSSGDDGDGFDDDDDSDDDDIESDDDDDCYHGYDSDDHECDGFDDTVDDMTHVVND